MDAYLKIFSSYTLTPSSLKYWVYSYSCLKYKKWFGVVHKSNHKPINSPSLSLSLSNEINKPINSMIKVDGLTTREEIEDKECTKATISFNQFHILHYVWQNFRDHKSQFFGQSFLEGVQPNTNFSLGF